MTLKQLTAVFSNETIVDISTPANEKIFRGRIKESRDVDKANYDVTWCEIHDNVLEVVVEK